MVLKADHPLVGETIFGRVAPFAAGLLLEPVVCPGLELKNLLAVEPMLHVSVVKDDLGVIPLAPRIDLHLAVVRKVHSVVNAKLLPFFKFRRSVNFLPTIIVNELIFRTGDVRHLEFRILDNVVQHSAVAAVGEFPVPGQLEILVLLVRYNVAGLIGSVTGSLDATVHHGPTIGQRVSIVITPAVKVLSVEEKYPSVSLLGGCQRILLLCAGNHRHGGAGDSQSK